MKSLVNALACGVIGVSAFIALPANAATKTQCENIARPAGYLTVETRIPHSGCPTRYANKYSTPAKGVAILYPLELETISPPFLITTVNQTINSKNYIIGPVFDGMIACSVGPFRPYNYFSVSYRMIPNCEKNINQLPNSVEIGKIMYTEIARPSGRMGEVRVRINPKNPERALTYAVHTTSVLHGGRTTVGKTLLSGSNSYTLKDLAPEFVDAARQGATFTFLIEAFTGKISVASETLTATGAEMLNQ